jgi:glycosyltransferase involved in cell wall biosynthesis
VRLLNCIFTYNRPQYLRNTIESLLEYFTFGDTVVFDDGSDEPDQLGYLSQVEQRGITVIRRQRPHDGEQRLLGGLYPAMNHALELATQGVYECAQLVQDDMQFMWHDPDLLVKVRCIFDAFSDASQVSLDFFKALTWNAPEQLEYVSSPPCYRHNRYGIFDTGIIHLGRLRRENFRFGRWEKETGEGFFRKGYRVYYVHSPVLARIPWEITFKRGQKSGRLRLTRERYYMKPLTTEQVRALTSRPLKELAYYEDYCFPWGWGCLTPYWHGVFTSSSYWKYTCCISRMLWMGRPRFPHWSRGS